MAVKNCSRPGFFSAGFSSAPPTARPQKSHAPRRRHVAVNAWRQSAPSGSATRGSGPPQPAAGGNASEAQTSRAQHDRGGLGHTRDLHVVNAVGSA